MMLIVRMFPRMDISKVWEYVEKNLVSSEATKLVTPLYATQTEGMMSVGVIFDVKDPDNIAHFLVDHLAKYDEVHHTKTVSLMKPTFFPIPKKRPHNAQRFIVRIYTHARNYQDIYNYLVNYDYPFDIFPIYVTYSLGDEDIILNVGAESYDTVNKFVREKLRILEGADTVTLHPVIKAKRFAPLEKLIKLQYEHLGDKAKKMALADEDKDFDWVEDFEFYAMLTGAFRRDL